jgi:outer membrane protein TolC
MRKAAVFAVLTILWAGNALALTMEEAVEAAREHNASLQQQIHLEDSARELEGVRRAPFFPTLDLKYSYSRSSEEAYFPGDELSVFTVEAAYNIFNGMTDIYNLKASSSETRAATYRQRSVRADTVFLVRSAYIGVLRARHAAETAREGVELLERQASDARRFYEAGLKSKRDYLQVEVELAFARQELAQAEGAFRVARSRLERVMGIPLAAEDTLEDLSETPEAPALSYGAMREEMLGQRSELKFLRAEAEANQHKMKAVRGAYLPSVNLVWQYNQYGDDTSPNGREFSYDSDTRTMVTASWRLFGGFDVSHALASAHSLIRAAEARITETERELEFQLREALEEFNVASEKLKVAEAAVAQAEENYRVTESSFKQNLATTTDLLDARTFLSRARTQYFGALYDMHQTKARIDRVLERGVY